MCKVKPNKDYLRIKKNLIQNIRIELIKADMTQAQLGKALGLEHSGMSNKMTGKNEFNFHDLYLIAKNLDTTIEDLVK